MDICRVREALEKKATELGLRMPQMQTLLSQERFLARLCQLRESRHYIWKGGSLLLRLYQHLEIPRFTVDIDFLVRDMEIVQVQDVLLEAMKIDLKDGFHFKSLSKSKMERETPYGGDRFEINWSLFDRSQSESLKIDVCAGDDVDVKFITSKDLFLLPEIKEISLSVYPAEFIFAEKLGTADLTLGYFLQDIRMQYACDIDIPEELPFNNTCYHIYDVSFLANGQQKSLILAVEESREHSSSEILQEVRPILGKMPER